MDILGVEVNSHTLLINKANNSLFSLAFYYSSQSLKNPIKNCSLNMTFSLVNQKEQTDVDQAETIIFSWRNIGKKQQQRFSTAARTGAFKRYAMLRMELFPHGNLFFLFESENQFLRAQPSMVVLAASHLASQHWSTLHWKNKKFLDQREISRIEIDSFELFFFLFLV